MRVRLIPAAFLSLSIAFASSPSMAAPDPKAQSASDAGRHFQRGVALFNEADYPGALAEFRRAYEIAPNAAVLYNIGQTHFQLRSYASALASFEKYLTDAGANAEHAKEAQAAIETLRARVGKVDVTAPDGAEIAVDDEVVGKAPLPPIVAAVGKRKITASKDGRQSPPRFVEIAAGEVVKTELKLGEDGPRTQGAVSPTTSPPDEPSKKNDVLPIALWAGAGALAAGAIVTGIVALSASSDLGDEKDRYPTSRTDLDDAKDRAQTFGLVTDILGGAAIVTAGVALYFTLKKPSSTSGALPPRTSGVRFRVGPTSAGIGGTF